MKFVNAEDLATLKKWRLKYKPIDHQREDAERDEGFDEWRRVALVKGETVHKKWSEEQKRDAMAYHELSRKAYKAFYTSQGCLSNLRE